MTTYTIRQGETILDVSVNATGSPLNIEKILDANNIDTWTPTLVAGQQLTIPDDVELQTNNLWDLQRYPVADCGFISAEEFDRLTMELEDLIFPVLLATEDGRIVITEDGYAISLRRYGNSKG